MVAIFFNGASYSDNFSTIFRVARGAEIEVIRDEDLDGKDPLPRHLSKAPIWLLNNKQQKVDNVPYKRIVSTDAPRVELPQEVSESSLSSGLLEGHTEPSVHQRPANTS